MSMCIPKGEMITGASPISPSLLTCPLQVVKAERNKNHTHTQALQQIKAEFIEKLMILANETEILRTSAQSKDK